MVDKKTAEELLTALNLTAQEANEVRDIARMLAELTFDEWQEKRKQERSNKTN